MKRLLLIITLILATFSTPVHASANDFTFNDFTADYYLTRDDQGISHLKVVETFTAQFPEYDQNHGLERRIPYTNQDGANLTTESSKYLNVKITRNDRSEPYSVTANDGYFTVRIGDADTYVHGEQVYRLEYEFQKVITQFADYQELYWDTNGTGWAQPFASLTTNFHVADDLKPALGLETWCYVGAYGINDHSRCTTIETPDGFSFFAENLIPYENLTFAVTFDEGTFTVPDPEYDYTPLISFYVSLSIFVTGFVMLLIARSRVSDKVRYYKNRPTAPEYTPLRGYTAAELAKLYPKTLKNPKVASLLELAVGHKIKLQKGDKKPLSSKYSWNIHVNSLTNVTAEQEIVLKLLNGGAAVKAGDVIEVKKRYKDFSSLLTSYESELKDGLKKKHDLEEKATGTGLALAGAIMVYFSSAAIPVIAAVFGKGYGRPVGAEIFTFAAPVYFIGFFVASFILHTVTTYASRTLQGLDHAHYLNGLKLYISMAEKDRLAFSQSLENVDTSPSGIVKLYEKLLPYATLFGLEKSWLTELSHYYEEDPDLTPVWVAGAIHTSDFSSVLSSATSAISSSISSSSSSGSGGGGFSGGGGGGGGGGGW